MNVRQSFAPFRVTRVTAETRWSVTVRLGPSTPLMLVIPNRLLSHFLDHFAKGAGLCLELAEPDLSGTWSLDHVWCEDLGQLVGRSAAEVHDRLSGAIGVAGRASVRSCMDDAESVVALSFEGRSSVCWTVPPVCDIDGWVDGWYEAGSACTHPCYGTNLRQFLDGFAHGGAVTLAIEVLRAGNLHHLYETIFRNLGDAVGQALGTSVVQPGQTSGLAAVAHYRVEDL